MESTTRKKLGTAGAGVAAVGAAVALTAGTFSYFSDSHSEDVHAETGTLTLDQSYQGPGPHEFTNLAPGESGSGTYTLTNGGTIDGELTVGLEGNGGNSALRDAIKVEVNEQDGGLSWSGTLAEAVNHDIDLGSLEPNESKTFEITGTFVETGQNQNNLQDQSTDVRVTAELRHVG